jgi:hypothetical protein
MDVEFLLSRLSTFLGLKLDSWVCGPERDTERQMAERSRCPVFKVKACMSVVI